MTYDTWKTGGYEASIDWTEADEEPIPVKRTRLSAEEMDRIHAHYEAQRRERLSRPEAVAILAAVEMMAEVWR
jgi:hypothetical protein